MEAVVAVYADWGIGKDGTQPVVIPEDRKHFAQVTKGAAVIVGRGTLQDFPGGAPLKGRVNIIITTKTLDIPGAVVVHSVDEALLEAAKHERCAVIGGASIYRAFFPYVTRVYLTKLDVCPPSDAYFPNLDSLPDWRCTDPGEAMESGGIGYRFCTYERL